MITTEGVNERNSILANGKQSIKITLVRDTPALHQGEKWKNSSMNPMFLPR
jgi:hypothetical protein